MDQLLAHLHIGLTTAVSPDNLLLCLLGCLAGTLIGVLPGLGPIPTIAMLLPVTFGLEPTGALIMLAGIFYGAQYGGSTSAILVNIPGEATSVVTAIDGHRMARQGRAGIALAISAIGSFIAGTVATVFIATAGAPVVRLAGYFGPPEYCALLLLGLVLSTLLTRGSIFRAMLMVALGLLLATVGADMETGDERFTFGIPALWNGIHFVPLAIGLFGFAEMLHRFDESESMEAGKGPVGRLLPSREELRQSVSPIARGTVLGGLLGILPGSGAILAPFASYALEKRLSETPERFGEGAIEAVAGPESANNAAAQTGFLPLLTIGIPPNAVLALMVGAMSIHGVIPGPQLMTQHPDLFWGVIVSMWIGNAFLLFINLPLIGIWVRFLRLPSRYMMPVVIVVCCIGVYSINNAVADIVVTAFFTVVGFVLLRFRFEMAPLLLAFVLGRLLEEKLRQSLILSGGSFLTFVERPVTATILAFTALALVAVLLPALRRFRDVVFSGR